MVEMVNNQPGQSAFAVVRQPDRRDAIMNFTSFSCTEGEHWRCSISPNKPMSGVGLRADDLAPKCVCDCHYTEPIGAINSMEILFQ